MEVQNLKPQDWKLLSSFLNEQLRPNDTWSMMSEYPQAFNTKNLHNIRIIKHNEQIISHAVLSIIFVQTPLGIFRVAAIGSIVTHSEFRHQGHSRKLIEDCLQKAKEQQCDFAILWTDIYDFYRKFDFELAGSEISYILDRPIEAESHNLKFYNKTQVDSTALNRLFNTHTVKSWRSAEDIKNFLKIPNTKLFTAWDHNHQLQAYAVEGKGADLKNYIHEWGGGVSKILPLLQQMQKHYKQPLTLIAPEHAQNLNRSLQGQKLKSHHGFLGMIKLIDFKAISIKIQRYARSKGFSNFVFMKKNDYFYFGLQDKLLKTNSEKDLVRLLFGPYQASSIHDFDEETLQVLEELFPIPMWIWGWDSI